jgi:hypothetical protein
LHHVADIDASLHFVVEAHLDHPPERVPVAIHEPIDGISVAVFGIGEQILRWFGLWPHAAIIACPMMFG